MWLILSTNLKLNFNAKELSISLINRKGKVVPVLN
jgi:hypothetical protein